MPRGPPRTPRATPGMTSIQHPHPDPSSSTGPISSGPDRPDDPVELAVFDPALHAAAVAERLPGAPVMAAGWWAAVTAPEDPRALELRHIPNLPAADAARISTLFAEVAELVEAGRACEGEAWEVLSLCELGNSPAAAAAGEAVLILISRGAVADVAGGMVSVSLRTQAWLADLLGG